MADRLVVTILGADRPGLVEAVSKKVADHNGNWEASRMARLAGRFAGVLLVSAAPAALDALSAELAALSDEGLRIVVERGEAEADESRRLMLIEVVGHDRAGIISEVSAALATIGVNIDELESRCESAAMAGHLLFRMRARVMVPDSIAEPVLRRELEALADDLIVDIHSDEPL